MDKFDCILAFFKAYPDGVWSELEYSKIIKLDDDAIELIGHLERFDLLITTPGSLIAGEEKNVVLQVPRTRRLFVAKNIKDIAAHTSFNSNAPEKLILVNPVDSYSPASRPSSKELKNYLNVISLISSLREIADHSDNESGHLSLIFLCKEKLEIPIVYSPDDLIDWEFFDKFMGMYSEEIHASQRRSILKNVLFETLGTISPKSRFGNLCKAFDVVFSKIDQNYNLYVSEFSFEKIRDKNRKEISSYLVRINKTFSDIQSQLLTLPIAGLIAASQMKTGSDNETTNFVIFFASMAFAWLISYVLQNYYSSINAIKKEIDEQKKRFEHEYSAFATTFNDDYKSVESRYLSLKRLGFAVEVVVSISLIAIPTFLLIYINHRDFIALVQKSPIFIEVCTLLKTSIFHWAHNFASLFL